MITNTKYFERQACNAKAMCIEMDFGHKALLQWRNYLAAPLEIMSIVAEYSSIPLYLEIVAGRYRRMPNSLKESILKRRVVHFLGNTLVVLFFHFFSRTFPLLKQTSLAVSSTKSEKLEYSSSSKGNMGHQTRLCENPFNTC